MKQVMLKLAAKPTNTYFQPAELFFILPVYIFYNIGPSSSGKTRAFGARIPQVRILSAQLFFKLPLILRKSGSFCFNFRPTGFEPTERPENCEDLEQFLGKDATDGGFSEGGAVEEWQAVKTVFIEYIEFSACLQFCYCKTANTCFLTVAANPVGPT